MNKRAEDSLAYNLRLYVAGQTPKSIAAICNLRRLCEKYLSGRYNLDVIDLMVDPNLAHRDQIVAIPTLVRHVPERLGQVDRHIGSTEKTERLLGWTARTGFEEGLERTVAWYRDNEAWWRAILARESRAYSS